MADKNWRFAVAFIPVIFINLISLSTIAQE